MLANLRRELNGLREPLGQSAHRVIAPSVQENFVVGGRPTWQPLADATVEDRAAEGFEPDQPLIRSGDLERATAQRARWAITNTEARFGNLPASVAYGRFHQTGTEQMPARPFAIIQDEDADATTAIFDRWIGQTIDRNLARWP